MSWMVEIAAFMLGRELANMMDTSSQLKMEKLKQEQMRTQMMQLQAEVAHMKSLSERQQIMKMIAEHRKLCPDSTFTDAELEADIRYWGLLT